MFILIIYPILFLLNLHHELLGDQLIEFWELICDPTSGHVVINVFIAALASDTLAGLFAFAYAVLDFSLYYFDFIDRGYQAVNVDEWDQCRHHFDKRKSWVVIYVFFGDMDKLVVDQDPNLSAD